MIPEEKRYERLLENVRESVKVTLGYRIEVAHGGKTFILDAFNEDQNKSSTDKAVRILDTISPYTLALAMQTLSGLTEAEKEELCIDHILNYLFSDMHCPQCNIRESLQ